MTEHVVLSVGLATALVAGACASTGGTPRPFPSPGARSKPAEIAAPELPVRGNAVDEYELVGTALKFRGVPYKNGGTDPSGFDCSGFTQFVFAQYGVALPREVREQFKTGTSIDRDHIQPGDLIFFTTTEPGPSHVGIAVGGEAFVHAPSTSGVVRVERFDSTYWSGRFVGSRRLNGEK